VTPPPFPTPLLVSARIQFIKNISIINAFIGRNTAELSEKH
jgi:hypothetical protein